MDKILEKLKSKTNLNFEESKFAFEEIMSGSSPSALDALEKASITQLNEDEVNKILDDLAALLQPASMTIEAFFNDRGGLSTQVKASYPNS